MKSILLLLSGAIGFLFAIQTALLQKVMSFVIFSFFVKPRKIRSKISLDCLTMPSQALPGAGA